MRAVHAGAVAVVLALTGCSGDDQSGYCDALEESRGDLVDLAQSEAASPADTLEVLESLRAESPADLQDEWDTFVFAWRDLATLVDELGVDASTFDPEDPPGDLAAADVGRLAATAAELSSPRVRDAVEAISLQALEVCDVDFAL